MMLTTPSELGTALMTTYPRLDSARLARGIEIIEKGHIFQAQYNSAGLPIAPTPRLWAVRGSAGWYLVDTIEKKCTCEDSQRGHVCKHRIAVRLMMDALTQMMTAEEKYFFMYPEKRPEPVF